MYNFLEPLLTYLWTDMDIGKHYQVLYLFIYKPDLFREVLIKHVLAVVWSIELQ
jgi:hypothetical protein